MKNKVRVAGKLRRSALKALGNGNPPQVAELIARTINRVAASPSPSTPEPPRDVAAGATK